MPAFSLEGNNAIAMPATQLVARGATNTGVPVRLELAGQTAPLRDPMLGHPDDLLAIAPVTDTWEIVAVNPAGMPFPIGTTVTVRVSHQDGRSTDPLAVDIRDVGLSGVISCSLARLEHRDDGKVTLKLTQLSEAEIKLSPQGEFSRAIARRTVQDSEGLLQGIAVVVDTSASLRAWIEAGAVASLIDILAGVDSLLDDDQSLDMVVGRDNIKLSVLSAATDAGENLSNRPLETSFVIPAALVSKHSVIITDTVPPRWSPEQGLLLVLGEDEALKLLVPAGKRGIVPVAGQSVADVAEMLAGSSSRCEMLISKIVSELKETSAL
ncbi:MAG: hypothetical protein ACRDAX_03290 [Propionibacteriaceae bacterium]